MTDYLLHHLLRRSAARAPEAVALVDGDVALSYRDLEVASDRMASLLVEVGVRRGDRVGLYASKGAHAVIAIYAVSKAGAAYVPIDPHSPPERAGYIAADCGVRVLISDHGSVTRVPALISAGATITSVVLPSGDAAQVGSVPGVDVRVPGECDGSQIGPDDLTDEDLAYILYTSGSTGRPKGVMLTHRNALGFVRWAREEFGVVAADRLSSHAPFHFDLSIFDLFVAAYAGATLVLVPADTAGFPRALVQFVENQRISVWYSVPSALSLIVQRGGLRRGASVGPRLVLFAGEVFPTPYLRTLMALWPQTRFCNLYGPTETNVCTYYWVPELAADDDRDIPIGRPIGNVRATIVDEALRPVDRGEVGELLVGGSTVMRGYWGDDGRTARALVPEPALPPTLMSYRTGDLVQEDETGVLRFLGRRDNQIKSRGYRIELGEIETALHAHPDVRECAAFAVPDPLFTNQIHVLVVAEDKSVTPQDVNAFCGERLPSYMVPSTVHFARELPRTSTGKVDRTSIAQLFTTEKDGSAWPTM